MIPEPKRQTSIYSYSKPTYRITLKGFSDGTANLQELSTDGKIYSDLFYSYKDGWDAAVAEFNRRAAKAGRNAVFAPTYTKPVKAHS